MEVASGGVSAIFRFLLPLLNFDKFSFSQIILKFKRNNSILCLLNV